MLFMLSIVNSVRPAQIGLEHASGLLLPRWCRAKEQANVSVILHSNMMIASEKSGQTVKHPLYLVG